MKEEESSGGNGHVHRDMRGYPPRAEHDEIWTNKYKLPSSWLVDVSERDGPDGGEGKGEGAGVIEVGAHADISECFLELYSA